jgi:hypothetical protein
MAQKGKARRRLKDYQVTILSHLPPGPPDVTNVAMLPSGGFSLSGAGAVGGFYILLAASNLDPPAVWTPLATSQADRNGVFQFTDSEVGSLLRRFYRVSAKSGAPATGNCGSRLSS